MQNDPRIASVRGQPCLGQKEGECLETPPRARTIPLSQLEWPTVVPQSLVEPEPHRVACRQCSRTSAFDGFERVNSHRSILERHIQCPRGHGFWIEASQSPPLSPTGWRIILPSLGSPDVADHPYRHLFRDERIMGATRYQLTHLPASFHPRPNQQMLATVLRGVWEQKAALWAQAGVGLGKTIAYLVPAIQTWWHTPEASRGPLILATSTIALQRQLESDLRKVLHRLGWAIPVLTVQGSAHYWCWQRTQESTALLSPAWEVLRHRRHPIADPTAVRRDQLPELPDAQWDQVRVDHDRSCYACSWHTQCGVPALQIQQARATGILIVNHGVLADDLIRRERGEPPRWPLPQAVIVDEAHQIDATLRAQLRGALSHDVLGQALDHLIRIAEALALRDSAWQLRKAHVLAWRAALESDRERQHTRAKRMDPQGREWGWGPASATDAAWAALQSDQNAFIRATQGTRWQWPDTLSFWEWGTALTAWSRQQPTAQWAITLDSQRWYRTPLDVNPVWASITQRPMVWISATLEVDNIEPVALPGWTSVEPFRRYRFQAPSPFDYPQQLRYQWVPGGPSRHQPISDQVAWIAPWIATLYHPTSPLRARILVLCTNKPLARTLVAQLRTRAIPTFSDGQKPDWSVESFAASGIYVSTAAWEGFDLPGPKSIVIPFLPNPVPTDPAFQIFRWQRQVTQKAESQIRRQRSLQRAWMLNRAQQGVGRAIRTITDQSVVYWLDPRLPSSRYQEDLQTALPQALWTLGPTFEQWSPWVP